MVIHCDKCDSSYGSDSLEVEIKTAYPQNNIIFYKKVDLCHEHKEHLKELIAQYVKEKIEKPKIGLVDAHGYK